ncbi:unnamed protein product [Staurois parvus]|uniref:Uncharacterized protein n=1 Tax=Staurois parvus TaxID=386267 RepID=A0ABN9BMK4_9NEOB|nr:unnamed protein product [Staurois parvus]
MDRGEFVTDRVGIPKDTGKGEAGCRKKRNEDRVCRVYWSKENMAVQDLGKSLQMLGEAEG